jgi:hypothetical protein
MHEDPRKYRLDIIREACQQYNLDGFELDFIRHPIFFAANDVKRGRMIMTEFVGNVRRILDKESEVKGRYLYLAVRVPPTFELSNRVGLDIKEWVEKDLIDILTAGSMWGGVFRLPVKEFIQATRNTKTQVHAHIGISCTATRGRVPYYSDAMFRAQAAIYWKDGVDGLYTFNSSSIQHYNRDWDWQPFHEIGDPKIIAHKDKHYLLDHHPKAPHTNYGPYTEIVMPPGQIPEALEPKKPVFLIFEIADDLDLALKKGINIKSSLQILFDTPKTAESTSICWNNQMLAMSLDGNWLRVNLESASINLGLNELKINSSTTGEVKAAELLVNYEEAS